MNLNRIRQLIKKDYRLNRQAVWITAALIVAILLLGNLFSPYNIYSVNRSPTLLYWVLFITGIWSSSAAFREAHDKTKNLAFFTLPCSQPEKFFSKWLMAVIILPIALILLYGIFYWIIAMLGLLINGHLPPLFNPFQRFIFKIIWIYWVEQSLFFLGSIYFKNRAFIKTLLCIVLFSVGLSIVTAILGAILAKSLFIGNIFFVPDLSFITSGDIGSLANRIHLVILIVLPIFCWMVSYVRLTETEV